MNNNEHGRFLNGNHIYYGIIIMNYQSIILCTWQAPKSRRAVDVATYIWEEAMWDPVPPPFHVPMASRQLGADSSLNGHSNFVFRRQADSRLLMRRHCGWKFGSSFAWRSQQMARWDCGVHLISWFPEPTFVKWVFPFSNRLVVHGLLDTLCFGFVLFQTRIFSFCQVRRKEKKAK